ncbi:hypothetical protein T02_13669 [Trichinella nativa]|uniref:Uncharacterized protein n=1 Tax=Trichinella nativa TaxID=6335 RepID=A0A0V1L5K9_9BILA|nr:hypothetical protein T02_13669 [Trichinella nativa]
MPIRRPQQARYVHYYFSEKAMPCDGVKVDDLQSLMFFEILELVSLLTPMRPRTLTADQGVNSSCNRRIRDLVPNDFLKQPNHQDLKPQVDHKQSLDWSIQRI